MIDTYESGAWNAVCAVCGFKKKSTKMRMNWKGFYVCDEDFEYRHPSDFLKARVEKTTVPFVRPDVDTPDTDVCYLWERSVYAGLATAACSVAGNTDQPYAFLLALKNGT